MRVSAWLLTIVTAAAAFGAAAVVRAADDEASPRRAHPLYDDGGTLDWRTRIGDAMEVAKERRRLIFVEWGRES